MSIPNPATHQASMEVAATEKELAARIAMFEAEVYRGDARRLRLATEAAHAALQEQLGREGRCLGCREA